MEEKELIDQLHKKIESVTKSEVSEAAKNLEEKSASIEDVNKIKTAFTEMEAKVRSLSEDKVESKKDFIGQLSTVFEKEDKQISDFRNNQTKGFSIKGDKLVDIMTTQNLDGDLPVSYRSGIIDAIRRRSNILSCVRFGRISTTTQKWYEYDCEDGEYECVGECELKPAVDFHLLEKEVSVKKLAAHTQVCTEAWDDIPFFATTLRDVHRRLHDDKLASYVFEEIKNISAAYLNPGSAGTVQDANDWDALLMVIASAKCLGCSFSKILVSCDKYYQLFTTKDKDCRYITAPFFNITADGRLFIMGVEVVEDALLTGDEYLAGAFEEAEVLLYKDFQIRDGYINDQFIHNAFTIVGESRFAFRIPCNRHLCFQFDNLATVVSDITK